MSASGGKSGEFVRGWRVLLGCMVGVSLGIAALPFYTAGVFVKALEGEFGWTRDQIALGALASTFAGALTSPVIGALVDRYGVRMPAVGGLLFVALGFLALSRMPGAIGVYIGIQLAMSVLASGSSSITFTRVVNAWFDRGRGLALGLTLAGTGLTATFAPRLISGVVDEQGWRMGYLALAITAATAAPVVFLLLGARSERFSPDGDARAAPSGLTLSEALRDPILWRLAPTFLVLAAAVAGWVLHLVPMLVDGGMSPAQAAGLQGALGLSVLAGRLITGYLADHLFAPRLGGAILCLSAAGLAALALGGPAYALAAAIALGLALGAEVDLIGYLTARYFGLKGYGGIYGLQYGAFIVGAGLSPVLIAAAARSEAGYTTAMACSIAAILAAAAMLATAPPFPTSPRNPAPDA